MQPKANLDLLRAMAVLLVFVEHILLALHYKRIGPLHIEWLGVAGVFMFFVHTSLVLMWSLERRPKIGDFYIRRFFRIYPLAILAIVLTVIFHIPTMQSIEGDIYFPAPDLKTVLVNLLLIQNLARVPLILTVMWTLPLEVEMYLYLPFLHLIAKPQNAVFNIAMLCALIMAFDAAYIAPSFPIFIVFVPCFLAGILAYTLYKRVSPLLPTVMLPVLVVVLAIGLTLLPSWRNGWWISLALGFSLPLIRPMKVDAIARGSHVIAKYSYGIYLLHPFCITLGFYTLRDYPIWVRIIAICLSLSASVVAAYHCVEKPMIDLGGKLANRLFSRQKDAVPVT